MKSYETKAKAYGRTVLMLKGHVYEGDENEPPNA